MTDEPDGGIPHDVVERINAGGVTALEHVAAGDLPAATAVYRELLALIETIESNPDVVFVRAHLLGALAGLMYDQGRLASSATAFQEAYELAMSVADEPMGPNGRLSWLDTTITILIGYAETIHKTAEFDTANQLLDQAERLIDELGDAGDRSAQLNTTRATLLMSKGDWARAEQLLVVTIDTTDPDSPSLGYLHTMLGRTYAFTRRLDDAEDQFQQAADAFAAMPWPVPTGELLADRANLAQQRGDNDTATTLYTEAAAEFTRLGRDGDLAICQQALATLATDGDTADQLLMDSLRRFTELDMSLAAADTMILIGRRAFDRGDVYATHHYLTTARKNYHRHGIQERCAQIDYLFAAAIETGLENGAHDAHERKAVDEALAATLPAALYLESVRYDFASGHARAQWLALAEEAMNLAFRLALRRGDQGLLFELVEFRCAGAPLSLASPTEPTSLEELPDTDVHPDGGGEPSHSLGRAAAEAAASEGLRVGPPPGIVMSAGFGRIALSEYIDTARERYGVPIIGPERTNSW
ncbi:hypothetical protein [Stackebrandtia soli]|uniref:hypothetical protein n=1 Tax=Stackebrandtia soli TaxID=1892856 RepID=UPI0039ED8EEB